jgi:hypothetical protein
MGMTAQLIVFTEWPWRSATCMFVSTAKDAGPTARFRATLDSIGSGHAG